MTAILFAVALAADPFVPFAAVPDAERLPRGAALSVADDGTFRVNGKPRYLTATLYYGSLANEFALPTSGYPSFLKWLYEDLPGYEEMQRLGIDAAGFEAGRGWMRKISPTAAPKSVMGECLPGSARFNAAFADQLPAYVDFTPAPWGHGGLTAKQNPQLPREAWTEGENHWVPYSIFHPEGRRLWLTMWEEGVKRYRDLPVPPWCYELMNEPSVHDTGAYAKAKFRASGRTDDDIEFLKFTEEAYLDLIMEGVRRIHDLQPGARVTVQPVNTRAKGVDLYRLYRSLDVVCSPTGGGGLVGAHLLRACADGKPIVDGETYVGRSMWSVRNSLIMQFARGFNASYTFKWSRRPQDWARGGNAAEEEPLAKKLDGYYFLNPYVVPTEALLGFRLAKRDALDVVDLFGPRDRQSPRRVAVLYSKPTERLCSVNPKFNSSLLFDKVVTELDYAHLNPDVIFEEQLQDDPKRLDRYPVLFAAGIAAAYPSTPAALNAWQKRGGKLVIVGGGLDADERGRPNGATYPGAVRVASAGISAEELGKRLAEVARSAGVLPICQTGGAEKIEVIEAVRGKLRGWILISHALEPQIVAFRPEKSGETTVFLENVRRADGRVVAERCERIPANDGTLPILMEPRCAVILVSGPRAEIETRFPARDDAVWLKPLSSEEARRGAEERISDWRRSQLARAGGYHPALSRTRQIDLSRVANARRLTANEWGLRTVEGVPFDFIRTDQNFFKDVVRLTNGMSAVATPIDGNVLHAFFNYSGWPHFTAVYENGLRVAFFASPGDGENRRVWRWTNPYPSQRILTFEISADGVPSTVVALTVEGPVQGSRFIGETDVKSVKSRSGAKLVPQYANGVIKMLHGETPAPWSALAVRFQKPIPLPQTRKVRLAMELNVLPNRYGKLSSPPALQINWKASDSSGHVDSPARHLWLRMDDDATFLKNRGLDSDTNSWETVWADFDVSKLDDDAALTEISLQYRKLPSSDPGALAIRNLRLEPVGTLRRSDSMQ